MENTDDATNENDIDESHTLFDSQKGPLLIFLIRMINYWINYLMILYLLAVLKQH